MIRFDDLPQEGHSSSSASYGSSNPPSRASARPPAPAAAPRPPARPPFRPVIPPRQVGPVRTAAASPAAPARPVKFAKRSVCAFDGHVSALETVEPGKVYILVVTCKKNTKGYDDDLVLQSLSEAPDLAVLAAPSRKGPFQSGEVRYDRRDRDPIPED